MKMQSHLIVVVCNEAKGMEFGWLIEGCISTEGGGQRRRSHVVDDDVQEKIHSSVMQSL